MEDLKIKIFNDIGESKAVESLLAKSFVEHRRLNSTDLAQAQVEFRHIFFLNGLKEVVNHIPKKEKIPKIINLILLTFASVNFVLDEKEAFVLYHLRDLGKFRLKDEKLFHKLEESMHLHPEYKLELTELRNILKELKNIKLLNYRRGTTTINTSIMVS